MLLIAASLFMAVFVAVEIVPLPSVYLWLVPDLFYFYFARRILP